MPLSKPIQVVIFGGSGDLTRRKLIPALLVASERFDVQVVGVGRRPMSDEAFRADLREAVGRDVEPMLPHIHFRQGDVGNPASLVELKRELEALGGEDPARLCYLALKPSLFAMATHNLREVGIVNRQDVGQEPFHRVVIEKPFGHDLESATKLNAELHRVLHEHQLLRIDHYLGKETVQNVLGLRFHNAIFEPLWNRNHVELVQITVAETVGMPSGRAAYYDGVGALRDMLQNHMLQVLALVAMEPPSSLDAEAVRDAKVAVLQALQLPDLEYLHQNSVRARYGPGVLDGEAVPGYLDEEGVPEDSQTETYVALRAEIDSWRWSGVPFLLRHGKRLPKRFTEVQVQFRMPPIQLFNRPEGIDDHELRRLVRNNELCLIRPNVLTLTIQPEERILWSFGVKEPGPTMAMAQAQMAFDYATRFGVQSTPAYSRLLIDALAGDRTLFLRGDEIEASWRFADRVRELWDGEGAPPLLEYQAGTWGPDVAHALFQGCEGGWSRG